MSLSPELLEVIAQTHLRTDGCDYALQRYALAQAHTVMHWLHGDEIPFFCAIWDSDEFSLMMKREKWDIPSAIGQAVSTSPVYKRITFDIVLDFTLVGYLAAMTEVLATHDIAVLAFSAFSRDHIFVQASDFSRAWHALQDFIHHCNARTDTQLSSGTVK